MISVLRVVIGSGCVVLAAVLVSVALRQYTRELTWRRVAGIVQSRGGGRENEIAYTDHAGQQRIGRHWGASRTAGAPGTGERITVLYHPRAPERIAVSFGAGVLALLTIGGVALGVFGLWMVRKGCGC